MASFWDAITGSAGEDAANANRIAAQTAFAQGQNVASQYREGALGELGTGLTQSIGALDTGLAGQLGEYRPAIASATDAGRAGIAAYAPLSALGDTYGTAVKSYLDELVGGPEGRARTRDLFETSPSYAFEVDEATRAAANKAASLGGAGAGATAADIANRVQNIARGQYGSYLDRLAGFVNPQLQATSAAASGIAGGNKTLADLYLTGGQLTGGAYGSTGTQKAGLYSGAGESRANVLGNVAGMQAQSVRDLGAGTTAANNLELSSAQNAAKFWGDLAGSALSAVGGAYGRPKA